MTTALVVRDRAAVPPIPWVRRGPVGRVVARLGEVHDVGVGVGTRAEGGRGPGGRPVRPCRPRGSAAAGPAEAP